MTALPTHSPSPPGYNVDEPDEHTTSVTPVQQPPAATLPAAVAASPPQTASPPPSQPQTIQQAPDAPSLPDRPTEDEFTDPKIASLHAIFPDFDAALLESVLDSVNGNEDRAVDTLLGMSDPDHVPTNAPTQPPTRTLTQEELDEEFARQLMLEDEQQYQQRRQPPLAYTPRSGRGSSAGNFPHPDDQPASPPKDTMADVQEQFSKIAESGKRTFSSIVSKVKAKVQEFDQARNNGQSSSSAAGTQPSWGASSPGQPGLDRHAQSAYYAPIANVDEPAPTRPPPTQGSNSYSSSVPSRNDGSSPGIPSPGRPLSPPEASGPTPPPPSTSPGRPNIDAGKIGLLPKRPVSLIGSNQPQPSNRQPDDDDEDELEYVENPFEEGKRT